MRQACLCLDPPRIADLPRHGAHAALARMLFLNQAAARAHKTADVLRMVALQRALKRAKKAWLWRIKTLGVVS